MPILNKVKSFFSKKKKLKKLAIWMLPFLAILSLVFLFRSCSNGHVKHKNIYRIGRESTLQIELLGRDRSLIAFTNDLMAMIGEKNQIRFEWIETNPAYLLDGLDNGSYDFILTELRPNVINQEHYDFSELLFDLGPVLIVRQDSQVTSLKEMQGQPIGIPYGLTTHFNALRTPGVNLYDMSFINYNNMNHALDALINDHIDGVIMKAIPAYAITQGLYAGKLKVVTAPFNDEGLRIVSLKNSSFDGIIELINDSIDNMRNDGSYNTLIKKWNLIDPQVQYWHPEEN